jgi:hypothetical protein
MFVETCRGYLLAECPRELGFSVIDVTHQANVDRNQVLHHRFS